MKNIRPHYLPVDVRGGNQNVVYLRATSISGYIITLDKQWTTLNRYNQKCRTLYSGSALFSYTKSPLTRHKVQENGRDWVQRWTVRYVRTPVAQHTHDPVRDGASLSGQMIWQAVLRVHKRRQHDRLVR